jgi:hypothetical protein
VPNAPSCDLHRLGWKSFQDLCIAIAEECLNRPVQTFLPSNDAGRDGAFIGRWDKKGTKKGSSVIQCKFTSNSHKNVTVSLLSDELKKASRLAKSGLAEDYIILTNYGVSGATEKKIADAFHAQGVGRCRTFGRDWIVMQIMRSSRLRMMVPRLYGLGDLSSILDERAYDQAQMILSAMGDDLKRLVVTEAYRSSVRAITRYNFVLLLGAPAAGKSTIGAGLAVGAADIWKSRTIRAAKPDDIQQHINPHERQFFWIDDAWGSTQYQRESVEDWNRILPLVQSAIQRGTQFLLTSRDYIWRAAKTDLNLHSLPLLQKSNVVIDVHNLLSEEKAQILYNHLKLGDQPLHFRKAIKPFLPEVCLSESFLPETARRLGTAFFSANVYPIRESVLEFFDRPEDFLLETIRTLASDCRAAIALIFLPGGRISSPVEDNELLRFAAETFGTSTASIRDALTALEGSLLLLAYDEHGRYWTYKHPTIGDAFARLISNNPELTHVYLRGAKPESILRDVVCAGVNLDGSAVQVPKQLHSLLWDRLAKSPDYRLRSFLSYRANREFCKIALQKRGSLLRQDVYFLAPIKDDSDAQFFARLFDLELLPEAHRRRFVEEVHRLAAEEADASFLEDYEIRRMLKSDEAAAILKDVESDVIDNLSSHVRRLKSEWNHDYPPEDQFESLERAVHLFARETGKEKVERVVQRLRAQIQEAVEDMSSEYETPKTSVAPTPPPSKKEDAISNVFRDIDD